MTSMKVSPLRRNCANSSATSYLSLRHTPIEVNLIRALNNLAHLPTFYNPDLSMRLSQHLFGAEMAVYRSSYSMSLLPGEKSVYKPPALPSHIPGTLNQVVGVPSDGEIKSVQGVLQTLEHLAHTPHLFDANLNMELSQHMFNLQFARYMHDSSEGRFVSASEAEPQTHPLDLRPTQNVGNGFTAPHIVPDLQGDERNLESTSNVEQPDKAPSELTQLGETMKAVQDATSESKDILKNMDRVLTLIQRNQLTIGGMDKYYHLYKDPVNRQGKAATECSLEPIRFGYYQDGYKFRILINDEDLFADYLKFFGVGDHLIKEGDKPKLINGKKGEAEKLILKELGVSRF
ncbi:hypothetical protein OPQ81_010476 [Rhizoctonia solani]|nr:hypothetical protein OPQ81_010476 [Rhizoctonia solani]